MAKNDQRKRPNLAKPPKGLTFGIQPGKKQFQARWRELDGSRKSVGFSTEEERAEFAVEWEKKRAKDGKTVPLTMPKEALRWKLFAEITDNADPIEVAKFWAEHHHEVGGELKLSEAIVKYEAIRKQAGISPEARSHDELHLERFSKHFEGLRLRDIHADDVRKWIAGLKNPDSGAPVEPWTARHHLKSVKVFFKQAVLERWLTANVVASISPPKVEEEDVTVLSVDDVVKLFTKNRDALCIGRLALEAFGGLRFSSAARLKRARIMPDGTTKDDIDEAARGIEMPGKEHKSGRRHYVDGYPDNLFQWIAHAPAACWDISPRQYLELKSKAFRDAGVVNPGNVLRHSFCSYHVAMHKDAARTAVLLTHRSPSMLYQHYKGRATEPDAKRYFSITPKSTAPRR